MTTEQKQKEEERDQDMAHVWTQMDLLTKWLLDKGLEKFKVVDASNTYDEPKFDFDKEAKFLNSRGDLDIQLRKPRSKLWSW